MVAVWFRIASLLLLLCVSQGAATHPAPFSYLNLHVDGRGLTGTLVIHDFDAAHELSIADPRVLLDYGSVQNHRDALIELLGARLNIQIDGDAMAFNWGAIKVQTEQQSLLIPFNTTQSGAGRIDITAQLFPYDPTHQTFVNIYEQGQLAQQSILSADNAQLTHYAGTASGRWAVIKTFVGAGSHHILIGADHLLFLLGLMLLGGTGWRIAAIVTAFTVGHSITLTLATLDIVRIAPSIVEPVIALSIVIVGVDNLLVARQRGLAVASSQSATQDLRPWLAIFFGLIHGFGFAAVLMELDLPRRALGWSLAAFNLGVEIGQLAVVAIALCITVLFRAAITRWRCALATFEARFLTIGSIGVIAAGVYWFVQRVAFVAA